MFAGDSPAGELGHERQVGQLAEGETDRFGVRPVVVAGHGPDAGRERHTRAASVTARAEVRAVALIVADPTTRVPS